jgi:prepilin-type N-terminal cleavage/methylation domain-containing protein
MRGFTLIESLIVAVILTALFSITTQFFIQTSNVWQSTTTESDLRLAARGAIEEMSNDLRYATRLSNQTAPSILIPLKPNNNNLTFYLPNESTRYNYDGDIIWETGASNTIIYQRNATSNTLDKVVGSSTPEVVACNVTGVEFEDVAINPDLYSDEVRVILVLQKTTPLKKNVTVSLSSIINLRN